MIVQGERVVVGHCRCGRVLVVLNNRESWPLVECICGAKGDLGTIKDAHRVERLAAR